MDDKRNYTIQDQEPDFRGLGLPEPVGEARRRAGMTVPDTFFADFQQRIEAEIDKAEASRHAIRHRRTWQWAAAAVVLVVAVSLTASLWRQDRVPSTAPVVAWADGQDVSDQETGDMLMASLSDFDIYEAYYDVE